MLAALECVDYVTCIEDYSAVPAINSLNQIFILKEKILKIIKMILQKNLCRKKQFKNIKVK